MARLRTTIEINTGGLDDYSVPVEIAYSFRPGFQATYTQPGEADTVSLEGITVIDSAGGRHGADWLIGILENDEELLSLCALDHEEGRIAAEEYRAEAAREERLLGDRT